MKILAALAAGAIAVLVIMSIQLRGLRAEVGGLRATADSTAATYIRDVEAFSRSLEELQPKLDSLRKALATSEAHRLDQERATAAGLEELRAAVPEAVRPIVDQLERRIETERAAGERERTLLRAESAAKDTTLMRADQAVQSAVNAYNAERALRANIEDQQALEQGTKILGVRVTDIPKYVGIAAIGYAIGKS